MYLKEKQYKIAMILLCPVQGPWASSQVRILTLVQGHEARQKLYEICDFVLLRDMTLVQVQDTSVGHGQQLFEI